MAWHDRSPWAHRQAVQAACMDAIEKAVTGFKDGSLSFDKARETIRELIEPPFVRVGKGHTPEVQS